MRSSGQSMWWGAGLSVLVHGLVVLLLLLAPHRTRISDVLFSAEVDLAVAPDETPEEERLEPEEETDAEAATETVPTRRRRTTGAMPTPVAATVDLLPDLAPATVPLTALPTEPGRTDPEHDRERIAAILDPARYARDAVIRDDPGPSRRGPPAGGGDAEGGLGPEVAMLSEAEAEAAHSGHLRDTAMARPWLSHTPIVPVEQPDGSWVYSGPLFTARISPEGAVSFSDRDAVSYDLGSGTGGFDLTDMMMGAAGSDPYAAERERFMEETETLRERLETSAREEHASAALMRLRGRLPRVWADEDLSAPSRRRRLFSMWDEADDPIDGPAVRQAICSFICDNLPDGSPDAYSAGELAGLNATRESEEIFAPYSHCGG